MRESTIHRSIDFGLAITLVCMLGSFAIAQGPKQPSPQARILSKLVPPHIVFQNQQELDITADQLQQFRQHMESFQENGASLRETSEKESERLIELLDAEELDAEAATRQIEVVVKADTATRQAHLRMMVKANSLLSKEQRAKAFEIHKTALKERAAATAK